MSHKAILCVDDEAIILMHLVMILEARYSPEFMLMSSANAAHALALIDRIEAEGIRLLVVVSDWQMPGMKGDEFLLAVRMRIPDIKTIMVSGKTDSMAMQRLKTEAGLVGFLSKPLDKQRLFDLIDDIIAQDSPVMV